MHYTPPRFLSNEIPGFKSVACINNRVKNIDWPQSLLSFFCIKTDNLSKVAVYKLNLE